MQISIFLKEEKLVLSLLLNSDFRFLYSEEQK